MKHKGVFKVTILSVIGLLLVHAQASELEIPNTFQDGQVTSAAEMNANFEAIKAAVNDNHALMNNILSLLNDTSSEPTGFVGFTPTAVDVEAGMFAIKEQCNNFVPKSRMCNAGEVWQTGVQVSSTVINEVAKSEFEHAVVWRSGYTCDNFRSQYNEAGRVAVINKLGQDDVISCKLPTVAVACCK